MRINHPFRVGHMYTVFGRDVNAYGTDKIGEFIGELMEGDILLVIDPDADGLYIRAVCKYGLVDFLPNQLLVDHATQRVLLE